MNILFIGPYRQADGWGAAARNYIRALSNTGHELAIRPVYMGHNYREGWLEEDLLEYEFNDFGNYDVIVQNCLPHYVDYNGNTKNILLCYTETNNLQYTSWPSRANLMDEIWVPSLTEKRNLTISGVEENKIKVIPIPTDIKKFDEEYDNFDLPAELDEDFIFYYIGEYIQRKNVGALITAFHSEFEFNEKATLLIKTNKSGVASEELSQRVKQKISNNKSRMRMYADASQYRSDILITSQLTESQMMSLHQRCDCFVMPSHGESWCIPAFDAMGFGKVPIVTANTGMQDFVSENSGWVVDSYEQPVKTDDPPLADLYTSRETWQHIDILKLMRCMREAYENRKLYDAKSKGGKQLAKQFSYKKISEKLLEVL